MSRGQLSEEDLTKLAEQLPELSHLQGLKGGLAPDLISIRFPPDSWVPVAGAALIDAISTAEEAAHALHECLAQQVWYRQRKTPPNEIAAVFFGRFYATDLALRVYARGEHVANAVRFMLDIDDTQLAAHRKLKASQASNVGNFLLAHHPGHPITTGIAALGQSDAWRKTIQYRDRWTHEQPPTLEGLGMVYGRSRRWSDLRGAVGNVLRIGGSDTPEYTVGELLAFMKPAFEGLVDALRQVLEWYRAHLTEHGYDLKTSGDVTVKL